MLWLIGVPLTLVAVWLTYAWLAHSSHSYRFRMTVEVDTPAGVKSGSSVYEVRAGRTGAMLPNAAKRGWNARGEAVAVDLPNGETLFALLKTGAHFGDMAGLSMNALHPDFRGTGYDIVGVAKQLASGDHPGPAEVAPADYPMLVTFGDIADPTSVERVDPADLAASFGPGVTLKRIVVEVTDDPVTTGIEKRLAQIGIAEGHGLDRTGGVTANPSLAQQLGFNDFLRR